MSNPSMSLAQLRTGDLVEGRVHEVIRETRQAGDAVESLIISFSGDLLRVQNKTKRRFKIEEPVYLVVRAVAPLQFQLLEERTNQRRDGRLDLFR
jgi:hypothetical protein